MDGFVAQKEAIEEKIVGIISAAIEAKTIEESELSPISTYVLNNIDNVENEEGLLYFLEQLSARWPIFEGLYAIEKGGEKEKQEEQAIHSVETLLESGQIDQALAVAKQATEQPPAVKE